VCGGARKCVCLCVPARGNACVRVPGFTTKSVVSSLLSWQCSGGLTVSFIVALHASDHSDALREGGLTPHCRDVAGLEYCLLDQPRMGGGTSSRGCSCGWPLLAGTGWMRSAAALKTAGTVPRSTRGISLAATEQNRARGGAHLCDERGVGNS
jgi:hypothetical protein